MIWYKRRSSSPAYVAHLKSISSALICRMSFAHWLFSCLTCTPKKKDGVAWSTDGAMAGDQTYYGTAVAETDGTDEMGSCALGRLGSPWGLGAVVIQMDTSHLFCMAGWLWTLCKTLSHCEMKTLSLVFLNVHCLTNGKKMVLIKNSIAETKIKWEIFVFLCPFPEGRRKRQSGGKINRVINSAGKIISRSC